MEFDLDGSLEDMSPFFRFCKETLSPIDSFTDVSEVKPARPPLEPIHVNFTGAPLKRQPGSIACNCKRSQCLKFYCECYAANARCSRECRCMNCFNQSGRQLVCQRTEPRYTVKGCNCKKTGCRKKYCECFLNKLVCTNKCRCDNCENSESLKVSIFQLSN